MTSRSLIQRTCVLFGLIGFAVCLFYFGKGHTLLLDTNMIEIGGREFRAHASATVSVDGKELNSSMGRAERAMVTVSGPRHTIAIIDDADPSKKMERTFSIPTFMDRVIVSIPAILGDAPPEHWIAQFVPPSVEHAPVEQMQRYQKPASE